MNYKEEVKKLRDIMVTACTLLESLGKDIGMIRGDIITTNLRIGLLEERMNNLEDNYPKNRR